MAIEITKRGELPEEIKYAFKCRKCGTEFTATRLDGKVTYDKRDGNFLTVTCPLCNDPVHNYSI